VVNGIVMAWDGEQTSSVFIDELLNRRAE